MSLRHSIQLGTSALIIVILVRIFAFEVFIVPTDSMSPTIQKSEKVFVNKLRFFIGFPARLPFIGRITDPFRFTLLSPKRNDIIVFIRNEQHNDALYVKRIYAAPHDTLYSNDTTLWVQASNNVISYSKKRHFWMGNIQSPLIVPAKGDTLRINSSTIEWYKNAIEHEGTKITIVNNIVYFNGKPQNHYIVRNNYYVVLGDNLSHSSDSRFYGFVPENTIYGSPLF